MASSSSSSSSLPGPKPMETSEAPFSERVKNTFGSLFASLQPSTSPSHSNPPWSLSGEEAQKREWRRDKDTSARDANPCSSSFDGFLSHTRKNSRKNHRKKELDDGGDEEEEDEGEEEGDGGDLNDWDVRSSIGLDSTLDNEEEEDTFDKVAIGRENAGERLYMRDIKGNNGSRLSSQDDLPVTIGKKQRDPRANRQAARIRLKEDDAEAGMEAEQPKGGQAPLSRVEKKSSESAEDGDKLKPILKRKECESTLKPSKRVRFDPECISSDGGAETIREVSSNTPSAESRNQDNGLVLDEKVSRVPDYVRNPSKYKCYSLDSTDEMNDKSNAGAFLNHLETVKRSENAGSGSDQVDAPMDLPKSITFVPKKKSDTAKGDGVHSELTRDRESHMKHSSLQSTPLVGIAVEEDLVTEVGDMDIDTPEPSAEPDSATTFKKQGRQYRSKPREDSPS